METPDKAPSIWADLVLQELLAACEECDCLGFDTPKEAARAVLSHPDYAERWECTPRLVEAIQGFQRLRKSLKSTKG